MKNALILSCLMLSMAVAAYAETDYMCANDFTRMRYASDYYSPGSSYIPPGYASPPPQFAGGGSPGTVAVIEDGKPWSDSALWKSFLATKSHASFKVQIHKSLPELNVLIVGKLSDDFFYPSQFVITDASTSKLIQQMNTNDIFNNHRVLWNNRLFSHCDDTIQFIDLNNDGYLDFRILYNAGATGNDWYASFLYDSKSRSFKFNRDISELSGVRLDTNSHQITTYNRCGWCLEFREYFKIHGDKLKRTKVEWTEIVSQKESKCLKITGIPSDDHLRIRNIEQFVCDDNNIPQYIKKQIKIVKKESIDGSLDDRNRGLGGEIDRCERAP